MDKLRVRVISRGLRAEVTDESTRLVFLLEEDLRPAYRFTRRARWRVRVVERAGPGLPREEYIWWARAAMQALRD
ncbi:MAG: hypothetical protein V1856_02060 [Candidatus Liptonbacteria bacterium]